MVGPDPADARHATKQTYLKYYHYSQQQHTILTPSNTRETREQNNNKTDIRLNIQEKQESTHAPTPTSDDDDGANWNFSPPSPNNDTDPIGVFNQVTG